MRACVLALLVLLPAAASAQESAAVRAAQATFQNASPEARQSGDLADLHPVAVHAEGALTFVTLVQRHDGLEVFGTASTAAVHPGHQVTTGPDRFQRGLARRAEPAEPDLAPEAALDLALDLARRASAAVAPPEVPLVTDDPEADAPAAVQPAFEATPPRLGYHAMPDGTLRLAYEATVTSTSGPTVLRLVRLDATTGEVLVDDDLRVHDTWGLPPARLGADATDLAPTRRLGADPPRGGRTGRYRVVTAESPTHGSFVFVSDPADPVASPLGWHRTGSQSFTTTRGNNVHAYADTDGNNQPDPGSAPDGGAGLTFDFPFDPESSPDDNADAALTNLFYWSNVSHDVAFRYGFTEAAGNFQVTNAPGEGRGGDAVRAEALDGAGSNNARFSTPPDGQPPRMEMFRWTGGVQFSVTAPAALAGSFPSAGASFGPSTGFSGRLATASAGAGPATACTDAEVTADLTGHVALIERGGCDFDEKVARAQRLGAVAVVMYNRLPNGQVDDNGGEALVQMGGDDPTIDIPSVFVQRSTGLALRAEADPVDVALVRAADRGSSLDAGVVIHEYAHGISNRLVGGPSEVACLRNGFTSDTPLGNRPGEQMGEGWSDWYGMVLTQQAGDTGAQPRGVGTYLRFQLPDGRGIRNAPYSTDFAVNDYTYDDLIAGATHTPSGGRSLSIPHGVGFVWATMLWEMTWALIDAHGYSPDLLDAEGSAGNQIALRLVTTGLKLTPCSPGFVDGRDAILAADQALHDGAYTDLIWQAFARRGLGVEADQGASTNPNDGRASFLAPGDLGAVTLSTSTVTAALRPGAEASQTVRLSSERGVAQTFVIDPEALPPWVAVAPASGTLPAGGAVDLTVTLRPSPLDTGDLTATVPVDIEGATRLLLSVQVATDAATAGTHELSVVGPNPASEAARATLAVAEDQAVRAALYDGLGRLVAEQRLAFQADVRQAIAFDVSRLGGGVYVLRVTGETFAETRTLTVVGR
ncbi:MAG: M36 family metallopeptidase [Bacteroidota bacterium]